MIDTTGRSLGSTSPVEMVDWDFVERLNAWLKEQPNLKRLLYLHIRG